MARQHVNNPCNKRCRYRLFMAGLLLCFIFAILMGIFLIVDSSGLRRSTESSQLENEQMPIDSPEVGHTLCVIVPFRDRFEELLEFAPHLHDFLNRQSIEHKFIVVSQLDKYRFNRASLINVGFLESRSHCDYIAMHDIDLLPMNYDLSYSFPELGPYHVSAPHLHPLYHYKTFVGGILLIQSKHFEMLNGLSNRYWGWGREDDDFYVRIKHAHMKIVRPGNLTSGYKTFRHIHDRRKRPRDQSLFFNQLEKTRRVDKETGVSTIKYKVDSVTELVIAGAPVTVYGVSLECDLSQTPWCLQANEHQTYNKSLLNQKQGS